MAKIRPARGRQKKSDVRAAAPCLILVVMGMGLFIFLFYLVIQPR